MPPIKMPAQPSIQPMQLPQQYSGLIVEELSDRHVLGISERCIELAKKSMEASELLHRVQALMRASRFRDLNPELDGVPLLKRDLRAFIKDAWDRQNHPAEYCGLDVALRYCLSTLVRYFALTLTSLLVLDCSSSAGQCKTQESSTTRRMRWSCSI
jgi:hypothetical protein